MKIYIGILSITFCVLQVSDGKPPKHGHGQLGSNDIYATVKPRHGGHGGGHGHGHHHHGGSPDGDVVYASLNIGGPSQDPVYENVGGRGPHRYHGPDSNDPETLYSPVNGPGHGGRHGGGGWGGGNDIGDPDDDDEPTHGHLPFQTRSHGAPPLPPRPPGGHPDPHRHHPGHNHGNAIHRRGGVRR